jgi:hypothetical protein
MVAFGVSQAKPFFRNDSTAASRLSRKMATFPGMNAAELSSALAAAA